MLKGAKDCEVIITCCRSMILKNDNLNLIIEMSWIVLYNVFIFVNFQYQEFCVILRLLINLKVIALNGNPKVNF